MKKGRGNLALSVEEDRQQRPRPSSATWPTSSRPASTSFPAGRQRRQAPRPVQPPRPRRPLLPAAVSRLPRVSRRLRADRRGHAIPEVHPELRGERDLGYILHDIDFADGMTPAVLPGTLRDGVIDVPPVRRRCSDDPADDSPSTTTASVPPGSRTVELTPPGFSRQKIQLPHRAGARWQPESPFQSVRNRRAEQDPMRDSSPDKASRSGRDQSVPLLGQHRVCCWVAQMTRASRTGRSVHVRRVSRPPPGVP